MMHRDGASCWLAGTTLEKVPWLHAFRFAFGSESDGICAAITRSEEAAGERVSRGGWCAVHGGLRQASSRNCHCDLLMTMVGMWHVSEIVPPHF